MTTEGLMLVRHLARTIGVRNSPSARRAYEELRSRKIDSDYVEAGLIVDAFGIQRPLVHEMVKTMHQGILAAETELKTRYGVLRAHLASLKIAKLERPKKVLDELISYENQKPSCPLQTRKLEELVAARKLIKDSISKLKGETAKMWAELELGDLSPEDFCDDPKIFSGYTRDWRHPLQVVEQAEKRKLQEEEAEKRKALEEKRRGLLEQLREVEEQL